jgi:50S ribosomal protein L16 3-hydroxylase
VSFASWIEGWPEFKSELFGSRHRFFSRTEARAAAVRALVPSWKAEDVLRTARSGVNLWIRNAAGLREVVSVTPDAARSLYGAGMTLYLKDLPWFSALADDVAQTLGVPQGSIECSVFCNKPGAVTPMHFDGVDTLAVQVTGTKSWRVAPNRFVSRPTVTVHARKVAHPAVRLAVPDPLPTEMPADSESFTLDAGAMLHLPAGTWHFTQSDEESVSLHIHLTPYSWADALLATLRAKLLRSEAWRSSAHGLRRSTFSGGRWNAGDALHALRAAVDELSVEDLVPPAQRDLTLDTKLRSRARSGVSVGAPAGNDPITVAFTAEEHGNEHTTSVEMSPEFARATLVFAKSSEPLTARDLVERVPGLDTEEALALLRVFLDVGYARYA